jgi:hypothetical protein
MHAARRMKKLRASDSADAIVDGLRAEVYVPSSLRPLSVLDLALPRRIKRIRRPSAPPGVTAAASRRRRSRASHTRSRASGSGRPASITA